MKKYNLPVILLKGIILFPKSILKLEFDKKNLDNNVIDTSIMFHNKYILVVSNYDVNNKPKIGILSKIEKSIELPNGNTRVDLKGIRRVEIINFLNLSHTNEPLESIVKELDNNSIENEEVILNKVKKEIKKFVSYVPYVSNSLITIIDNENNLSNVLDISVPNLINEEKLLNLFLNEIDINKRVEMLLKFIYEQTEVFKIEENIDNKVKQELDDTQKEYLIKEKIKYLKEEINDTSKDNEIEKLREKINNLQCSKKIKSRLELELNRYEKSNILSPETNIIRDYIDWLINLPYNIFTKDNDNLKEVKNILDKSHFGLKEVKTRIIEYLAISKINKNNNSPIICLVGPPGVGKTTLAISIAKAINKNFVKISVGGIKDESEIMGHRRTYIGAMPGRIISSIRKANSCNPLVLIDEIDKMSSDYKGDPTSALLSVLDKEQNKYFSDNYIEEECDLSNVLFILTANYIEDIPEALRDRLEIINITGYTEFEKIDIAKKYLIPKILKNNGSEDIKFNNNVITKIIRNYTKEAGVRELERQLDKIVRKIVTNAYINNKEVNKIININQLEKYLGKEKYKYNIKKVDKIGVVNGLAYTPFGGDTLPIEVNYFKGNGKLILTGSLGDVMKESATIALSYLKSNARIYNINYDLFINYDIHIHVPEGAIKKDGPSAGAAITLAIYSALTNTLIPNDLAMTGEITLRGHILEIGGLKEKSIGALRSNINKIIIPYDNNIDDIPKEVTNNIKYYKVKEFKEILEIIKKEV